jgi:hypothetical protein
MASSYGTQAVGLPCLICGADNSEDSVLCRECSAPMALVHDALAQQRDPRVISVIGESNVGKTVYLGFLLDMLSQRAGDFEAVPKGSYSIDLQQNVITHMAHRMFPPKTPMEANQWYWAYYQVRRRTRPGDWYDLIMPDIAGESLAAEVAAPDTFRVVRGLLSLSGGLMLLVDAALAANGASQPDFFAVKILSYVDSMLGGGHNEKVSVPISVVLCKADYCPECFDDPHLFAQANLNRLWNLCESRFATVSYFACSVVGSLGYATSTDGQDYVVPIPLHAALRGVLEPFEWIIDQV